MKKASINMDGPAIRELFSDRENIMICRGGDAADIAEKILMLRDDPALRSHIANGAYRVFQEHARPTKLVKPILKILQSTNCPSRASIGNYTTIQSGRTLTWPKSFVKKFFLLVRDL